MRDIGKKYITKYKVLYTCIVILIYLIGKSIPLYKVYIPEYAEDMVSAESVMMQAVRGDIYSMSVFALGMSPFIIASIVVQIINAFRKSEIKSKISPKKINRMTLTGTLIMAIFQAVMQTTDLIFVEGTGKLEMAVVVIELVAGAFIIMLLASNNKKYGVGGQSTIILINIIDNAKESLENSNLERLMIPFVLTVGVAVVTVVMENAEKRIPVQKISIHNIYADKNYLAIKLNPIGVMPAMFSTAFYMIPKLILKLVIFLLPDNTYLSWLNENYELNKPIGIIIYVFVLYIITVVFARVFVNPKEITEQFLKNGDSLVNIHAGRETKKYLGKTINHISMFSASIMSLCLVVPMYLQAKGYMGEEFTTLPTLAMMITGLICNIQREIKAYKDLEGYKLGI